MGIKQYVKDWMSEKWEQYVKNPIENATVKYENQVQQTVSPHINKVKETAYKPKKIYNDQPPFYRGLFWIGVALLIVLWIISGS